MIRKIVTCFFNVMVLSSFLTPKKIDLELLKGKWTYKEYNPKREVDIYMKVKDVPHDKGSFDFRENGVLMVKQNSGWCGTPPIHYQTVEGKWEVVNDSVVRLEYRNWRGNISKQLHVVSLNKTEMAFKNYNSAK